ncbi:glycine--tRNA ligase subunit beta [Paenibacillus apiarius]|uniref:Glycine--tRNA ligase beta subunit n=1 Tax=Paenibacillus apiarius TaxID=46240 RepID=A0ABT4DL67_9BACL|nr:glycine--tRNA ligase subunit beta [Paenibacillus apiarius]MCY9513546.1 glycine--tRNA ligase subunit beta [Paenibacillus apiarius]MCY9518097.1 glycine--tRNA ligase subunit beta [Paenibacillus apiarius]MCY9551502.1 glycine--tRNA ligase subunit beta [Paenibacillus apiarius]MCY9558656.1 glycine--tRNA ligase subunit beta [Paenibacillus apiarius]MCY9684030.1 glycine--tRNA ligase subunit beta [Paenibacillus apiarius]
MPKHLLLELGLEEVPARFMRGAMGQLRERLERWLTDSRIAYGDVQAFATPRRLAVLVHNVADKQTDIHEEVKGPAKKIALDENGAWTKAALGFARGQGVEPEQFFFKELNGVEYIYANKSSIGTDTAAVLVEGLTSIIHSMTFPKNMRWGANEMRFVRPIRWIVALHGTDIIPLEIEGVQAQKVSRGHRFLGGDAVIEEPAQYVERLREQFVIVDVSERETEIARQIEALAAEKNWNIAVKDDLLEEVLFLVEYPTVLFGAFEPSFLSIPQDVLITSMREHQRYFPVLNAEGQLMPYFVTVRNGDSKGLDMVAKGNEKVLRARLSDAKFFYQEDQKLKVIDCVQKLDSIVFHEELGTIGDKVRRIHAIADALALALQSDRQTALWVSRAADICKFDLVTQMVYEFPELQGVMGEDYARKAGEPEEVAHAINEHYKPRFAGDPAPESLVGSIISMADKLDTLVGCFGIGIIPTGSQDPYGLRRQATGIVQILLERELPLTLHTMFNIALDVYDRVQVLKRDCEDIRKDLYDFFGLRVKNVLSESVRYDVVDAIMASGYDDVKLTVARGEALMQAVTDESFKLTVESFNRVCNLASKAASTVVDESKFQQEEERMLYVRWTEVHQAFNDSYSEPADALAVLGQLKEAIHSFFDNVMVMAEDDTVRANRLALLKNIAGDIHRFADFSKLVWA